MFVCWAEALKDKRRGRSLPRLLTTQQQEEEEDAIEEGRSNFVLYKQLTPPLLSILHG